MNIKNVSFAVLCAFSLLSEEANALPGQSLTEFESSQYSTAFGDRTLQPITWRKFIADSTLVGYSTRQKDVNGLPIIEQDTPDIYLWVDQVNNIVFEGLASGRNGVTVATSLLEADYDPRKNSSVVGLATSVWGDSVAQDFADSRFTDSFIYRLPRTNEFDRRRIYVGKQYIHELIGSNTPRAGSTGFLYNLYLNREDMLIEIRQTEEFESRE